MFGTVRVALPEMLYAPPVRLSANARPTLANPPTRKTPLPDSATSPALENEPRKLTEPPKESSPKATVVLMSTKNTPPMRASVTLAVNPKPATLSPTLVASKRKSPDVAWTYRPSSCLIGGNPPPLDQATNPDSC